MMSKEKVRCAWCLKDDLYKKYHDEEWGKPVKDDTLLFEFLILESFQAGLSWHTVLKKRENFRLAFKQFDAKKVSKFTQTDIDRLMADAGIIRNKLKIEAAINNAKLFLELQKQYGSFANFIWKFTDHKPIVNHPKILSDIKPTTEISDLMSKELGKLGFKFRGSTICYAFMQAVGMVDDHLESCWRKKK
ncbi:MAG: hypothetical protein RL708_268 [Bacteroidota bacterium]|jgi:DNA-3-methyladenine glycosylase I